MESSFEAVSSGPSSARHEGQFITDTRVQGEIQAIFALVLWQKQHPEIEMDPFHPDSVSRQVRSDAMLSWLEDGGAEMFRDYVEDPAHTHTIVNKEDPESLQELLQTIQSGTVH